MSGPKHKILIVDDEAAIRDSLRLLLKGSFDVMVAEDGEVALNLFESFEPDLLLLDVMMPKIDGIEVLKQLQSRQSKVPVIMLTAVNTVRTAVDAMKSGAVDFLGKPFDVEELTSLILRILERSKGSDRDLLVEDVATSPPDSTSFVGSRTVMRNAAAQVVADFGPLVGKSPSMAEVFARVKSVAQRDTTVLITGESGTGKELIARQIHDLSPRNAGPFVAINCAAIPESLIESELFGHEKGAFTHAVDKRIGHFELANGGTLFLDEIGELSLGVQVKMLRFLQEQEFYRVGRSKPITVDVRVVTATNKNLDELVKAKLFRQDLLYRINVVNIALPPLRERYDDIENLVEHFIRKLSPRYDGRALSVSPEAIHTLMSYQWPGNVRELENVVESLLALCPSDCISSAELPRKIREPSSALEGQASPVFAAGLGFEEAERIFETDMIIKALKRAQYVQTRAAELLGISRRILKYKMDKLGISDKGEVGAGKTAVSAEAADLDTSSGSESDLVAAEVTAVDETVV